MRRRSICILGGTGFVGHHLVARLARDGHDMTVLTRYREAHRDLLVLPTLRLVEADVHDPLALRTHFTGCDTVINLVGILNERGHDGSGFAAVHTRLAESVVSAARVTGVRRLLHMSALKADPSGPSHYLRSKGEAERAVREGCAGAVDWTIFRPSVIFGPGDSFFNRFAGLLKTFPVLPLARPNARFAPVYVGDVAEAFARALATTAAEGVTYELCGPFVYSLREIVELTAGHMGVKRAVVRLPTSIARLQARIMDFLPGKPFSTDNFRSLSVHSICNASAPGLKELGIRPAGVESVLDRYLGAPADDTAFPADSARARSRLPRTS
ncbi:MAG: complex I NDUFA9 subunit family protein [Gammaproteobacteria bacterium]